MRITIIGTGYVGLVTGACFASLGHAVTCVDINEEKVASLGKGIVPFFEEGLEDLVEKGAKSGLLQFTTDFEDAVLGAQIVFIAVGTPPKEDGSADTSFVLQAVRDCLAYFAKRSVLVIKSTVPVGTNAHVVQLLKEAGREDVYVVSNPEFLQEGKAVENFFHPDRIVIGSNRPCEIIRELYKDFVCPVVEVLPASAEMIKYASNAFLATKISFINEIANVCEGVGADVEDVAHGMGYDPRIGEKFLQAGLGYGGSCFPKDVRALHQIAGGCGYPFQLLSAVIEVNNHQRWRFYTKIQEKLGGISGKKIAVLGLAFKPGTDDVRESIGIDFARKLVEDGAIVSVFDPKALENSKNIISNVIFADSIEKACEGADGVILATAWDEFLKIDWSVIARVMPGRFLFDGRRCVDVLSARACGFTVIGVGTGA